MKRIVLLVAFLALSLGGSLSAQDQAQRLKEMLQEITSPRWLLYNEAQERPIYRALWNGKGVYVGALFMFRAGAESELALTDEQNDQLSFLRKRNELAQELTRRKFQKNDPELMAAYEVSRAAIPADDPYLERATEEQKRAYVAANEVLFCLPTRYMDEEVEAVLTPEQLRKVELLKLQLLPEMGLPVPSMFEPLGLSDEQREQMSAIQKEMAAEFEELLDETMALRKEQLRVMVAEVAQSEGVDSFDKLMASMKTASGKAMQDAGVLEKSRRNTEKGQRFATQLKWRLMNVLTDDQLDKMQKLLDNSPEFVKKALAEMRRGREAQEKEGAYQPGPDSWRPGDGTPEWFKSERKKGGFPKGSTPVSD